MTTGGILPFFLNGAAGPVFSIYHAPPAGMTLSHDVIYLPPFAEEMNRSRRMAALQAQALARLGFGVLLLDLYGSGDSAGDFTDARWDIWRADTLAAADWLCERGTRRVSLWGLRLGAILAAELAQAEPSRFERAILWQPVHKGNAMLTQFLRLRIAAQMGGDPDTRETTRDLRALLAAGKAVEIAGYELSAELATAVDGLDLAALVPHPSIAVDWLEVVPEADRPLSPASRKVVDVWRERGARVSLSSAVGEPFWSLLETTVAPRLIDATCRALEETPPA